MNNYAGLDVSGGVLWSSGGFHIPLAQAEKAGRPLQPYRKGRYLPPGAEAKACSGGMFKRERG